MFGIGFGELILIFVVALLVVGPQKLPEMARTLARVFREVRKTSDEFQASIFRESGPTVSGLLKNPEATIKRHLESEVEEALGMEDDVQDEVVAAEKKEVIGARETVARHAPAPMEEASPMYLEPHNEGERTDRGGNDG